MGTSLAELPDVNDLVDVTLDSRSEPLAAVVSAVTVESVLLAQPMDRTGRVVRPETGEAGLLVWGGGSKLQQVPIEVLETTGVPDPTWLVRPAGAVERAQRRSFVRANVSLPVLVRHEDLGLEITAVDLSEGGMRCYTGAEVAFERGVTVMAEFVPGLSLAVPATVIRLHRGDEDRPTELGLQFNELGMADADNIRRYVFRQLHEQRRRGVE